MARLKHKDYYKKIDIINIQGRVPLRNISGLIKKGEYLIDFTDEEYATWDDNKKSKLIESTLMNIPISSVIMYEYDYTAQKVLRGGHRLKAISDFFNNEFELTGLSFLSELNGKLFIIHPFLVGISSIYSRQMKPLLQSLI